MGNNLSSILDDDLSSLSSLTTLNLSFNKLSTTKQSVGGLLGCPFLCCLDLRHGGIQIDDALIDDILSKLPKLRVLYLMSNGSNASKANVNTIDDKLSGNYRKQIVSKCANLRHLDDRPVFAEERRCTDQWAIGGPKAEKMERAQIKKEKQQKQKRNHGIFANMANQARNGQ